MTIPFDWGRAVAPTWLPDSRRPACDCPLIPSGTRPPRPPFHRWNCALTPVWAQTIRDLDVNPWTVIRPTDPQLDNFAVCTCWAPDYQDEHCTLHGRDAALKSDGAS